MYTRGDSRMSNLSGLVLSDFVLGVLLAILALAVGAASLRNVDLYRKRSAKAIRLGLCTRIIFRGGLSGEWSSIS
jgi:hypothetical protein